ncbi:MAG: glycine--tRNA ligase subunit beta [Candidatus Omnitrophica bacterium]|nr:glycine--tRNA ligase subunit beta [Candidatus Omnitrophota bacterium]
MDFLLEVVVEDLPADLIPDLADQLSAKFNQALAENRIPAKKLTSFTTIRRLVVSVSGLPEKQAAQVVEVSGPPAAAAFQPDGKPTPTGLGYCRAHKITPAELKVKDEGKKKITYYLREDKGRFTREILAELAPKLLDSLSFNLPMRWGGGEVSFIRPVTSILALLDDKILPLEFAGVKARPYTFGHPTLAPKKIRVNSIPGYFKSSSENFIILDAGERVKKLTRKIESFLPSGASYSPEFLNKIALTLEYPEAALSRLDLKNISYPEEAAAIIIEKLKCLPLFGPGKKLLPEFIIITDGRITKEIIGGFLWVLESRLEDGRFFWQEDVQVTIPEQLDKLHKVIFQAAVGSLADYSQALGKITAAFAQKLNLEAAETEILCAAARVAKVDAATSMVREFPEVAGIMAASLLARSGYPPAVAGVVKEHLLPRYSGDRLPENNLSRILSFSDKMLHLCGLFAAGIEPSGSSDPFGLRRLAQGALEIAWKADFRISLGGAVNDGLAAWGKEEGTREKIIGFLSQRIENGLQSRGFRPDVVAAALSGEGDNITAFPARVIALTDLLRKPGGPEEIVTFSRVTNILLQAQEKKFSFGWFQAELLSEEAEKELFSFWISKAEEIGNFLTEDNYGAALVKISEVSLYINHFFDKVMVMTPDETLRNNRLGLLEQIACALRKIGDLSKIQL